MNPNPQDRPTLPPLDDDRPSLTEFEAQRAVLESFTGELQAKIVGAQDRLVLQFAAEVAKYEERREKADADRWSGLGERLDNIDANITIFEERLGRLDRNLTSTNAQLKGQGTRITAIEARLDQGAEDFNKLRTSDDSLRAEIERLSVDNKELHHRWHALSQQLTPIIAEMELKRTP
jgi:chromosome segregation ATPase